MKMAGVNLEAPVEELLVLPRGEQLVVFKARPVTDLSTFEKLCPEPTPPTRTQRGGVVIPNYDDPGYKRDINMYAEKRMAYMIIKSLEATDGLTWETVNVNDANTWLNYTSELQDSKFSTMEVNRIVGIVLAANCLDEKKLERAREDFQHALVAEQGKSVGPNSEQLSTPSGAVASV